MKSHITGSDSSCSQGSWSSRLTGGAALAAQGTRMAPRVRGPSSMRASWSPSTCSRCRQPTGRCSTSNQSVNTIYATNDLDEEQDFNSVIDAIQGEGFNPLWHQVLIVFNPGFTPHQFTSEDAGPGGGGRGPSPDHPRLDGRGVPLLDRRTEVAAGRISERKGARFPPGAFAGPARFTSDDYGVLSIRPRATQPSECNQSQRPRAPHLCREHIDSILSMPIW